MSLFIQTMYTDGRICTEHFESEMTDQEAIHTAKAELNDPGSEAYNARVITVDGELVWDSLEDGAK